jgi:ubiquinone/menaquinone biosynthesis C-methylase UbiE
MDAKLQRRIQRYGWDKAAVAYEAGWRDQLLPAQSRMLDLVCLTEGEAVLDVACGTGLVTLEAASLVGPTGRVWGTDISDRMVDLARAAADAHSFTNTTFSRMDAEDLKAGDGTFDVALCALGLMYVPDPEKAVRELYRVLRHGGRAAAAVWGQRSRCGWAEIFPIVDSRVKSEVCPLFFRLGSGDALREAFVQAGFCDVRSQRIETRLRYASPGGRVRGDVRRRAGCACV